MHLNVVVFESTFRLASPAGCAGSLCGAVMCRSRSLLHLPRQPGRRGLTCRLATLPRGRDYIAWRLPPSLAVSTVAAISRPAHFHCVASMFGVIHQRRVLDLLIAPPGGKVNSRRQVSIASQSPRKDSDVWRRRLNDCAKFNQGRPMRVHRWPEPSTDRSL